MLILISIIIVVAYPFFRYAKEKKVRDGQK